MNSRTTRSLVIPNQQLQTKPSLRDGAPRSGLCIKRRLSGQAAVWLGWFLVGPASDFSEEPVKGWEPVTLDISAVPKCPAGPAALSSASVSMRL